MYKDDKDTKKIELYRSPHKTALLLVAAYSGAYEECDDNEENEFY